MFKRLKTSFEHSEIIWAAASSDPFQFSRAVIYKQGSSFRKWAHRAVREEVDNLLVMLWIIQTLRLMGLWWTVMISKTFPCVLSFQYDFVGLPLKSKVVAWFDQENLAKVLLCDQNLGLKRSCTLLWSWEEGPCEEALTSPLEDDRPHGKCGSKDVERLLWLYSDHQLQHVWYTHQQAILRHQVAVLQFNSILSWRQYQIPQVKGSILQHFPVLTPTHTLPVPMASPNCHLCLWPNGYKSEVPTIPSLGLVNFLERLTGLRNTVYSLE